MSENLLLDGEIYRPIFHDEYKKISETLRTPDGKLSPSAEMRATLMAMEKAQELATEIMQQTVTIVTPAQEQQPTHETIAA